jgi:hypothetical protein
MTEILNDKSERAITRKEYVERELEKWKDEFEIPFIKEFNVRALLDLQYSYAIADPTHIKSKSEILRTVSLVQDELKLVKKKKNANVEPIKLLIATDLSIQLIGDMFINLIGTDNILKIASTRDYYHFRTSNYQIEIIRNNDILIRGKKFDLFYKLS